MKFLYLDNPKRQFSIVKIIKQKEILVSSCGGKHGADILKGKKTLGFATFDQVALGMPEKWEKV